MKKLFTVALVLIISIIVSVPEHSADAQVASRRCCDANGVVRCVLENWTPVGNACFCYGQGWGYTC